MAINKPILTISLGLLVGILLVNIKLNIIILFLVVGFIFILSLRSLEISLIIFLSAIILFSRSMLFSLSIPIFGGGIKPSDLIFIMLIIGFAYRLIINKIKIINNYKKYYYVVIIFVSWSVIEAIYGIIQGNEYKYALLELRPIIYYCIVIPILFELNANQIKRITIFVIGIIFLLSIKIIVLYIFGIGQVASFTDNATRITSLEYIFIVIAIILTVLLINNSNKIRLLFIISFSFNIIALSVTYSRNLWIGLLISLTFLFRKLNNRDKRIFIKYSVSNILFILIMGILFGSIFGNKIIRIDAILSRTTSISQYREDVSAIHRFSEWRNAIEIIKINAIMGKGLGYESVFYSPLYSIKNNKNGYYEENIYIHNSYIWILLKTGIIGLISFLIMIYIFFIKNLKGNRYYLKISYLSVFVLLLFSGLFELFLFIDSLTPFVAFVLSAIIILSKMDSNHNSNKIFT